MITKFLFNNMTVIGIVGALLAVIGAGLFGYFEGRKVGRAELAAYREQSQKTIADLRLANTKINDRVVYQYITKTDNIRDKQIEYRDRIVELKPTSYLSNGWLHIHDSAAQLTPTDPQLASDSTSSDVVDTEALKTVVSNYGTCQANAEQLAALQNWIRLSEKSVQQATNRVKEK